MSASESVSSRFRAEAVAAVTPRLPAGARTILRRGVVRMELAADYVTAVGSLLTMFWIDAVRQGGRTQLQLHGQAIFSIAAAFFIVLLLERDGAYRGGGSLLQIRETERVLRISFQTLMFLLPLCFVFGPNILCTPLIHGLLILPLALMLQKRILLFLLRRRSAVSRVLVYGTGGTGRRVVSALLHSFRLGLRPVAVIDDEPARRISGMFELGYRPARFVPAWSGPIEPALLQSCCCDLLLVVARNLSPDRLAAAEQAARQSGVRIAFLSGPEFEGQLWTESIDLDGLSITASTSPSLPWLSSIIKRALDVVVSSLLLATVAPLLGVIGLLVTLDSPGPAFFTQRRVGRNGEFFSMYKFRTMYTDAPTYECSPHTSSDPRITRVGRLLRRSSLDELPQLINVLLGSMSLVGPRPEMPFIVQEYTPEQWQRLQVTPGITGLWQLSADRAFPIHEALQYDLYYIRNQGIFMDIAILIHTLFFAVQGGV